MPEFIVTVLVSLWNGPMIIEITAPSCREALMDVAYATGGYFAKILSCIEMIGV